MSASIILAKSKEFHGAGLRLILSVVVDGRGLAAEVKSEDISLSMLLKAGLFAAVEHVGVQSI